MPGTLKRCKQCGEIKPAAENFRKYYHNNAKGHYKICLACEKINNRYKYLNRKVSKTASEEGEIKIIEELYEVQKQQGYKPPSKTESDSLDLAAILAAQKARYSEPVPKPDQIPQELQHWLTVDLQAFTPDSLEVVSDELMAKYKKVIGVDAETLAPIYDDKFRDVLNEILKRFDDFEDAYYDEHPE
ncbi:hypothetical protein D3C75_333250 [compost metagenome]